jgi:SAM-dependent methyltransferase
VSWSGIDGWWIGELEGDPTYERVVTPLFLDLVAPQSEKLYLDLGCGEGRVMRAMSPLACEVVGIDVNERLAAMARPSVVAMLPDIPVRDASVDGVYSVLTLEHVADHVGVFAEAARVTREGGIFGLVTNHPIWTAPHSTPIEDSDGEILWRPGEYFSDGSSEVPAGEERLVFHHRTMASLLNAAALAGWSLERIVERPHHDLEGQEGIPRLLGCRWRLLP